MLGLKRLTDQDGSITISDPPIATLLFSNTKMAWFWLIVRVYLGWAWLQAGLHKLFEATPTGDIAWGTLNKAWMLSGTSIRGYWDRAVAIPAAPARPLITYDWFREFLQFLISIKAEGWMSKVIVFGEIAVGLGLIVGAFVGIAAFGGAFMNMNFLLAGTTSSNPVLFVLAVALMLAWKVAGYYGLDRVLLPMVGTPWRGLGISSTGPRSNPPVGAAAD